MQEILLGLPQCLFCLPTFRDILPNRKIPDDISVRIPDRLLFLQEIQTRSPFFRTFSFTFSAKSSGFLSMEFAIFSNLRPLLLSVMGIITLHILSKYLVMGISEVILCEIIEKGYFALVIHFDYDTVCILDQFLVSLLTLPNAFSASLRSVISRM